MGDWVVVSTHDICHWHKESLLHCVFVNPVKEQNETTEGSFKWLGLLGIQHDVTIFIIVGVFLGTVLFSFVTHIFIYAYMHRHSHNIHICAYTHTVYCILHTFKNTHNTLEQQLGVSL